MRNIIYTSLTALVLTVTGAMAGPTLGCFERQYDAKHLAANPDQVVKAIWLNFQDWQGEIRANLTVQTAHQGHAGRDGLGGQYFEQILFCGLGDDRSRCQVECDGGGLKITRDDGKILEFSTKNLWVGDTDSCGGALDLAEHPEKSVTYRLYRVADNQCVGN